MRVAFRIGICLLTLTAVGAPAQQVPIDSGSVVETLSRLKPGQYVWAPEIAPSGPVILVINIKAQRATLFRNGVPIAASTISTGRPGYSTPTGVFTILQKHVEHYSSKYDNAPMPYMQRLTWGGVALHAGKLPGYPASHGCIRMPLGFAKLLYSATHLGMTVVVTASSAIPRVAAGPGLESDPELNSDSIEWNPEKSPDGPVSIVVSAADRRAVVLRNGVIIGSGPVNVRGPVRGTWAYALRNVDSSGQHWIQLDLSTTNTGGNGVPPGEWQRFAAPENFRHLVSQVVVPGTTIVVTADSLKQGATGTALTILEGDEDAQAPQ